MLRSVLTICAILTLGWFGYWFWGANANKSAVENFLQSQENWAITYSQSTQRGFPNRYDVTFDNVRMVSKDGIYSITLPKVQIMRLSYRASHWIVGLPHNITLSGPTGQAQITATGFLGSAVNTPTGTRIALEADDVRIVSDNIFETPHVVVSAVMSDQTATLGMRVRNKAGQELRTRQQIPLGHAFPKLPIEFAFPIKFDIYSSDDTRLMQGDLTGLGLPLPIRISGKITCDHSIEIWALC